LIGSPAAERFLEVLNTSAAFQQRLRRCCDAKAVLAAAAAVNCPLTRSDLVLLALTAQHPALPWAGGSRQFARSFALGMVRVQAG
jgi:hypothetical protein